MTSILRLARIPAALVCFLTISGCAGTEAQAASDRLTLKFTAFRSAGGLIEGERGRFSVPENRTQPESRSIEIAFVRFRHPESSDGPPIVYLPGGPGQPVIQDIDHFALAYRAYLDIGGQGDMLVVEQRGIGASRPKLDCPGVLSRPDDGPLSSDDMATSHVRYINACMDYWRSQDLDFGGYNVIEMAADVDELRAALGYEKLKLFGESFGTHHALAMIALFGERIERAALTAVIGPDDMFELPASVDDRIERLSSLSRTDPALAAEEDDLSALMLQAFAALEEPITVSSPSAGGGGGEIEVGRYDLALATVTMLRQTVFLRQLPALYRRIVDGDASWLGQWSAAVRQGRQSDLASLLIACASGASPERRALIAEQVAKSPLGDAIDLLSADACTPFEERAIEPVNLPPISADMPVLMVSAEFDPRAPVSNADALLDALPNASHVVFPGVSHDFGDGRDALLELIYRFLAHGETTPRREPPPFTFLPIE
ncbi:MAG: alpha/beta hydrolase [Pseudomonadota bacterium]